MMQNTSPPVLFNLNRQEAIERRAKHIGASDADFLSVIASETISDRLNATNRKFEKAFDLYSITPAVNAAFCEPGKVENITPIFPDKDRETLDLTANSANLITSIFGLHRLNDLPGMLVQINRALMPDGLFMGALPGDQTLFELRACLLEAESILSDTASLRVDPFVEVRQAGGLLQRGGFALPVVDSDTLTVRYDNMFALIKDLRRMGATSALEQNRKFSPRSLFDLANSIYKEKYCDADGRIRASFEIIYLSGWKPHESQQKPLKPGSAIKNLKDFL